MKIVVIHGQNHKGSTYMVSSMLAEKVISKSGGVVKEFFLPSDFSAPCTGCFSCFKGEITDCPHYSSLQPAADAMLEADLIILDSPVYVYHATGQMMSFLDHFGTWWIVHRPKEAMCSKQAVAISTAAGGGMKRTCRDIADSLKMWGIRKVYSLGFGVQAASPDDIPKRILDRIDKKTDKAAERICSGANRKGMNIRARKWFAVMRMAHKHFEPAEPDYSYWENRGWHGPERPWK